MGEKVILLSPLPKKKNSSWLEDMYNLDGFSAMRKLEKVILRSCSESKSLLYANRHMGTVAQTLPIHT